MDEMTHLNQELMMLRRRVRELEQMPTVLMGGDASISSDIVRYWRPRWSNRFDSALPDTVKLTDFSTYSSALRYTTGKTAMMKYAQAPNWGDPISELRRRNTLLKFEPPIQVDRDGYYWLTAYGQYEHGGVTFDNSAFVLNLYAYPIWTDWDEAAATYNNWSGTFKESNGKTITGQGYVNYVTTSSWWPDGSTYTSLIGGRGNKGDLSYPSLIPDYRLIGIGMPLSGTGDNAHGSWSMPGTLHGVFVGLHFLMASAGTITYPSAEGEFGFSFVSHWGVTKYSDARYSGRTLVYSDEHVPWS